jgi:hypothetical protein
MSLCVRMVRVQEEKPDWLYTSDQGNAMIEGRCRGEEEHFSRCSHDLSILTSSKK